MILVIGAGISGITLAERYANVMNEDVLILDKRDHIGGNCYDFKNENSNIISLYGAHLFHTNNDEVWNYVNRFEKWQPYEHRVLSFVEGKLVPIPVNITTVNMLFGKNIHNEVEMRQWLSENVNSIENPKNSEESALSRVGSVLYEKMFKFYTKKQWDLWPSELEPSVMERIPVRFDFDDRYFNDKHQALPQNGFTALFEKMLDSKKIKVELSADYFENKKNLGRFNKIFYTGPIDQFFEYEFGHLQYRSIDFQFENLVVDYFQKNSVINYPNEEEFTRIIEFKYFYGGEIGKTVICKEYPTWEGEPYYPVPSKNNNQLYELYRKRAENLKNDHIYFSGRLGTYKYLNMDQAFGNTLKLFKEIEA